MCGMRAAGCCARWCVLFYLNFDVAPLSLRLAKTDSPRIKKRTPHPMMGPIPIRSGEGRSCCYIEARAAANLLLHRGNASNGRSLLPPTFVVHRPPFPRAEGQPARLTTSIISPSIRQQQACFSSRSNSGLSVLGVDMLFETPFLAFHLHPLCMQLVR
jgi:hypothetical protein